MSNALQILEKVNTFYSGAFSQLVTFTVGLLALVGVLIPIAIATYQNRQIKHDQKTLNDKIENDLSAARLALSEQLAKDLSERDNAIKAIIDNAKKEIAAEIKKIDELGTARSLHLQAISRSETSPESSAADSLSAATAYAKGGDERNLRGVLSIWSHCITKVTSDDFKFFDFEDVSKQTIAALETLNATGRYTEDIRAIRREVEEAKIRKPATD